MTIRHANRLSWCIFHYPVFKRGKKQRLSQEVQHVLQSGQMRRVQVPVLRVRGFDSHRVYIFFCRCLVRTYCTSKYFRRAILCDSHSLPPCLYGLAHQQCDTTKTTTALCTEILGQKASCCREHCAAERRRDGIVTHVAYVCMCRERPTAMSGLHAHRVLL